MSYGLVGGKILYSDSTHLKASANKNKFTEQEVRKETQDYISALNDAINEDRALHGKKPLNFKKDEIKEIDEEEKEVYFDDKNDGTGTGTKSETKTIKTSTTDPDSGFMHREGKPKGFFYLDHRTVDSKNNIITDVFVTPGNTNDVKPYIKRLDVQIEKFGFDVKAVGLDAGYNVSAICKQLFDRGIKAARIVNTRPIPQSDCKAINLLFACYGDCFYTKFSGLPLNMILCFFFFCLKTRHLQLLMYSISLSIFLTSMSFRTYFL